MKEFVEKYGPEWAELEKYRRVFYASPDYVTFTNLETGVFIDVNPGFEKMMGYRREDVLGRSAVALNIWVNADDRLAAVEELKKSGQTIFVTPLRTRSGAIIQVEGSLAIFSMNSEQVLVAVVRDVTARHRQEQELERYRTQLENLVEQRTAELEQAMQRVKELSVHDELTGVGNRRDLNNHLQNERALFERIGVPTSIAVMDMDKFKSVNDRFGHAIGDDVIIAFSRIVQHEMRTTDYLARYGGDEFVMLLRAATSEAAFAPLTRIREAVERHDWSAIAAGIHITTSIGVAAFHKAETADDTFKRADKALYEAKMRGRNCVVVATETT